VLLEHGHDPEIGNKPIAEPQTLSEDAEGAYYEARLFDGLSPLVIDGLRAGQYGASFRFSVMREEYVEDPGTSDENPMGLPERTLKELRVPEFGPVTFGAYSDATADVRSLTDRTPDAPPASGAAASEPPSTDGRRALHTYLYGLTPKEDTPSWRL
jgi:phage head maturation protease